MKIRYTGDRNAMLTRGHVYDVVKEYPAFYMIMFNGIEVAILKSECEALG